MPVAQRRSRNSDAEAKSARPRSSSVRGVLPSDRDGSSATGRSRPSSLEDLFGGGDNGNLLQGRFNTEAVYHWFQRRHKAGAKGLIDPETHLAEVEDDKGRVHTWKVPYGVRYALRRPLIQSQVANKFPWYVTWISPKTNKRMRKYFTSLPSAIVFVTTRVQYVDAKATIVSRHGYDIPPKLRGKIPKPYKWCPCCMAARRFYRTDDTFYGPIKIWNEKKQCYETQDRKLALMRCGTCGITNRDHKYRRSNQPWELRKFKRGVTRARRKR
jgi:hypothetical protein